MIRQFFSAATPSVRLAYPSSTSTIKTQLSKQPTWRLVRPTAPQHETNSSSKTPNESSQNPTISPRETRQFTPTHRSPFSTSTTKNNTPFRLSTEKHTTTPPSEPDQYSPYKPKRQWPPDMSQLSPKHQFRLERKYRRRAALKYARPKFIKAVTLAQWVIIGFVAVYAVLFMDWDTKDTPFDGIRESVFDSVRAVFSTPPPPGPVKRTDGKD